jgi:hypothetical protein
MIKFIEDVHKYFTADERELISVSAKVDGLKQKKDWYEIARKYAKKNGETAEYWQAKWKEKGEKSRTVGTLFHSIEEDKIINNGFEFMGKPLDVKTCSFQDGVKWSIPINNLEDNTIYPELMIYDMDAMVCGQSDKVITRKGKIYIYDYKTDEKIETKAYSSPFVEAEKLLAPCSHLDNCNYNLYSLKMSMYMYMLWKQNKHFGIGDLVIEHVNLQRDEDGIPILGEDGKPVVLDIKPIKLPYRKSEVIAILKK